MEDRDWAMLVVQVGVAMDFGTDEAKEWARQTCGGLHRVLAEHNALGSFDDVEDEDALEEKIFALQLQAERSRPPVLVMEDAA